MNVKAVKEPRILKPTTRTSSMKKGVFIVYPVKKFNNDSFSSVATLKKFGSNVIAIPEKQTQRPKIPASAVYATGKRKSSVARVWMWENPENGVPFIKIGKKDCSVYFLNTLLYLSKIQKPFDVVNLNISSFCVYSSITGGGISMQSEALALGLAKIIAAKFPDLKTILKKEKLLTRDSRIVEPKKTGLRGARKKEQYSKR